jgi:hypothetical protein
MTLPLFDEGHDCSKCGLEAFVEMDGATVGPCRIKTWHCKAPQYGLLCFTSPWADASVERITGEHLHRKCTRCGFEWFEACRPAEGTVVLQVVRKPVEDFSI